MLQFDALGRLLIIIGLTILVLGALFFLLSKMPLFNQLEKLPGDLRFEDQKRGVACLVPIFSSILISLVLTVILNVILRWLRK